jgi:hypothetical protein
MEMALRSKKTTYAAIVTALALAPALFGQQELRYEVEHNHSNWWHPVKAAWWPPVKPADDGSGSLVITEQGISYQETSKKKDKKPEDLHHGQWNYDDIQQLLVSPQKLTILTYKDRSKLRLGVDQQWEFRLPPGQNFSATYEMLKNRLDQRFVAAFAERDVTALWEIPVKLLGRIRGSEGILEVAADRIAYRTDAKDESRTWRLEDIENVSSSGPFQLTLTTYERAKSHYGNLKGFNFQLKRPLNEKQYNQLWRRVNQDKGLEFLKTYQEQENVAVANSNRGKEKTQQ